MRSIIDVLDLSVEELDALIRRAVDMSEHPADYADAARRKTLATLFFEPSTRTRLSFEAAMYELGGNVLSVPGAALSSAAKGESVSDTAKVLSCYADIAAIRHPREGAALVASEAASIPVINAGDGGHFHPTQTLADLLTIHREKGKLDSLTVGFCGDLKYGRTVHSLINAMARYPGTRFVLISPEELKLPAYVREGTIRRSGLEFSETASLEEALPDLDILYMTRIQRERFEEAEDYERLKNSYILTAEKMKLAGENCSILHPLPRVNEISVKVDEDPRACYFKQVKNGKLMRMALILMLLATCATPKEERERGRDTGDVCQNPRCITTTEQELPQRFVIDPFTRRKKCVWCETETRPLF